MTLLVRPPLAQATGMRLVAPLLLAPRSLLRRSLAPGVEIGVQLPEPVKTLQEELRQRLVP